MTGGLSSCGTSFFEYRRLKTGAVQIGMAIARRMSHEKKLPVCDKKLENAEKISKTMNEAGFDCSDFEGRLVWNRRFAFVSASLKA